MKKFILAATLLGALFIPVATAETILTFDPVSGTISGHPGDIVGWGFTLFNDTDYAAVTHTQFTPALAPNPYFDFMEPNFVVAGGTHQTITQLFDLASQQGVGRFAISASATPGTVISGTIQVYYDVYAEDPTSPFYSGADPTTFDVLISVPVSVNVLAAADVPEPTTLMLLGTALLALPLWRRRSRS